MSGSMRELQSILYSAELEYDAWDFTARVLSIGVLFAILVSAFFWPNIGLAILIGFFIFILFLAIVYAIVTVMANKRVALIEELLPDFLSIMSSNIRSGLTYDRALLLSARKEFGPLAREVDRAAKEALSGKPLPDALMGMTTRVRSETFAKTMRLIVEGIRSGGKLADLLETTSLDMRRFSAVRKDVTATVLVYQLFMLAASAIAGPLLYAVAVILVQTTNQLHAKIAVSTDAGGWMPIAGGTSFSPEFVFYFSIVGIIITGVFSSLAAGVISKGKESEGYAYMPVVIVVGLLLFFVVKLALEGVFAQLVV
ncbi:MAG: type II secretion system F family protein [Candidatus Micrarchaeota archaeon]|nr:type II secretion system F family protein [Candidatus Micrarchaeota archaeon]